MPGAQRGPVPVLRMYGVTAEGHSVMAHIHGMLLLVTNYYIIDYERVPTIFLLCSTARFHS